MSQETSVPRSRFVWSFFLALLLFAGLLVVNSPRISRAVSDNLAALTFLREWGRESKDISQVICEHSSLPLAPAVQQDQSAVINAAREAYFLGNCERALANWTLAAENDPQQETVALMRYLSSGLDPQLLPATITTEETADFLQGLGLWAEQNEDETGAAYWLTNAFDVRPSRSIADRLILSLQEDDEKLAVWQQLAGALPQDDADHWWALGQQSDLVQAWSEAVDAYREGALISPEPYEFLIAQGVDHLKLDQLDEAQSVFEQALSLKPERSLPYLQLGNVSRQRGELQIAREWYERAAQLAPNQSNPNYWLGRTTYELGELDSAILYLTKAININPGNGSAYFFLAQSLYQSGRQSEAMERLEEATGHDNAERWRWLVTLGDWRRASGDSEGALEAYKQALQLQPEQPKILNKIQQIENS